MLRLFAISTGAGYSTYLSYDMTEKPVWEGRAAERLQLKGEVELKHFEVLREGKNPLTGEVLRERAQRPDGIAMYDAVVMAPKSVSTMALFDDKVGEAHREAVEYTRRAMEDAAMVRVDRRNAISGELAQAIWHHENSRALDPQKHTHLVTINITWSEPDQKWRALNAHAIYKHQYEMGEIYRYALAEKMERLGYKTIDRESGYGFEVDGVSKEILEKYSQRSKERDLAVEGFREYHGREPSREEVSILVRNHRPEKQIAPTLAEIKEMQIERLTTGERHALVQVADRAIEQRYEISVSGRQLDPELMKRAEKFALYDHYEHEPGLDVKPWEYAEESRRKNGYRI